VAPDCNSSGVTQQTLIAVQRTSLRGICGSGFVHPGVKEVMGYQKVLPRQSVHFVGSLWGFFKARGYREEVKRKEKTKKRIHVEYRRRDNRIKNYKSDSLGYFVCLLNPSRPPSRGHRWLVTTV
jgi:hypothetical protein